jgi:co-chaperonin GroES (HSP10)
MNSCRPFGRRIQVRPEQQRSVIATPDANLVERATVLAVGDEVRKIAVGDTVLFTSFGVDSVDLDGERHYFLMEDDAFILATIA